MWNNLATDAPDNIILDIISLANNVPENIHSVAISATAPRRRPFMFSLMFIGQPKYFIHFRIYVSTRNKVEILFTTEFFKFLIYFVSYEVNEKLKELCSEKNFYFTPRTKINPNIYTNRRRLHLNRIRLGKVINLWFFLNMDKIFWLSYKH